MKQTMTLAGILLAFALCLASCNGNSQSNVNVPTEYCEELVKLAEEGNVEAQMNLAKCYAKGEGVERNDEEANKWFLKAAEQGNTDAMGEMGNAYLNGWGVPVDYKQAVQWLRKAAEQGNAVAQSNLGVCYEKGTGVPQNRIEAFNLFQKAAEQGNAPAQHFLADYYFKDYASIGIAQDFDKAFDLYLKRHQNTPFGTMGVTGFSVTVKKTINLGSKILLILYIYKYIYNIRLITVKEMAVNRTVTLQRRNKTAS